MGGGQVGGLNILPKKRWHVRTKDNIARVRRDKAAAADVEKRRQERIAIAEQEARTSQLRKKAAAALGKINHTDESQQKLQHVNLFVLEQQKAANAERELEKKLEQQKRERAIGLLKGLGDVANDDPWYLKAPTRVQPQQQPSGADQAQFSCKDQSAITKSSESVQRQRKHKRKKRRHHSSSSSDSSTSASKHRKKKKSRSKRHKSPSRGSALEAPSSSQSSIELLRQQRLERELKEKVRAEQLLLSRSNSEVKGGVRATENIAEPMYNSQFNPELCRQNRTRNF